VFCPDVHDRHIFLCGPEPFADAVKAILKEDVGFDMKNYHTESFGGKRVAKGVAVAPRDVPKREATVFHGVPVPAPAVEEGGAPPAVAEPAVEEGQFEINFVGSGVVVKTSGDAPLLDLAEANGIEIDYACRTGSCGECLVLCKDGQCEMDEDEALEDEDREKGYVLACTACPRSNMIVDV
jgi:ferredoxin